MVASHAEVIVHASGGTIRRVSGQTHPLDSGPYAVMLRIALSGRPYAVLPAYFDQSARRVMIALLLALALQGMTDADYNTARARENPTVAQAQAVVTEAIRRGEACDPE